MLDQFLIGFHPYIIDVVDVKVDHNCGYHVVAALLSMGEVMACCVHELT